MGRGGQFMPREKDLAPQIISVDQIKELVARILDSISSDPPRLKRFLLSTGFQPETLQGVVHSPLFMLSVLGSVTKDEELLHALGTHEQVELELINSARARLVHQVTLAVTQHGTATE
jgi:hypothetical protein